MSKTILKIQNLTKVYANGFRANDDISLEIREGQFFGLLGVNGAGKSTLLNIVSDLVKPTSGSVEIYGHSLQKNPIIAKQYLGIVPQEVNLNQFESIDNILHDCAGLYGLPTSGLEERIKYLLENLGLSEKRHARISSLSGGMKRRALIARALINQPKILLLDEPTAGVDVELRHSLWEFISTINKTGTTVILTTHYLEEAEKMCDHIAMIHKGVLLKNAPKTAFLSELQSETVLVRVDSVEVFEHIPLPSGVSIISTNKEENEITLKIPTSFDYNTLFRVLLDSGLVVRDFRHLENRLENMFLSLIRS